LKRVQELRHALKNCDILANLYNEETEEQWELYQEEMATRSSKSKANYLNEGKRHESNSANAKIRTEELKKLFQNSAQHNPHLGYPVLGKGVMISVTGEFYRKFGKGRQGMSPKEWREKILRTVNEAFTGGSVNTKTGTFTPFDHDEDGCLDLQDFIRFFTYVDKQISQEPNSRHPHKEEESRISRSPETKDTTERKEEDKPKEEFSYKHVFVDTLSARKPIRIGWKEETLDSNDSI